MNIEEYVDSAVALRGVDNELWQLALGVGGEAGEVQELVKKSYRPGKELNYERLEEEIGDVLWYLVNLSEKSGLHFPTIMKKNIVKLTARYAGASNAS